MTEKTVRPGNTPRQRMLFLVLTMGGLGLAPTACSPANPDKPTDTRAESKPDAKPADKPEAVKPDTKQPPPTGDETSPDFVGPPSPPKEVVQAVISDEARKALDDEWEAALRLEGKGARLERTSDKLHVVSVSVSTSTIRDADLADLKKMPRLKALVIQADRPDQITNAGFAHVAEVKTLERLEVPGLGIDDDACEAIGRLSNLTVLELGNTLVSDDGLTHAKKLVRLSHLGLAGTRATGERLADLAPALKSLKRLDLRGVPLTTAELAAVGKFVGLEELYLPDAELPKGQHRNPVHYAYSPPANGNRGYKPQPAAKLNYAAGVKHLSSLVNLKSVAMTKVFRESVNDPRRADAPLTTEFDTFANLLRGHTDPLTGKPWTQAEAFTGFFLVRVDANGNLVCKREKGFVPLAEVRLDAAMVCGRPRGSLLEHLKGFKHVTSLDLSNLLVTDDDLKHLAGHTKLERLDLSGQYVTAAGLAHLKGLPLKHLNLRGCPIGDGDLPAVREIRTLKEVVLSQTKVTEAGAEGFRRGTLRVVFDPEQKRPVWCDVNWAALVDAAAAAK